jgi:mono/diheme cytochrome c family protein
MAERRIRLPGRRPAFEWGLNGFWRTVLVLAVVYLFLRYGVAYLTQAYTGASTPQPVPSALLSTYIALAVLGLAVQVLSSEESLREFREPLLRLLRGEGAAQDGTGRALRWAALAVPPLLVGWMVYQSLVPKVATAATSRQQHPALPAAYADIDNPLRALGPDEQQAAIEEGIVLYQVNCRPCHGTPAHGEGPLAHAFRPRPIAFVDAGTIDTIVESYPLWRIEKGGLGLPSAATPWNSAMPPWEGELTTEEMWKIIMAEYDIAGKEPRIPERLH